LAAREESRDGDFHAGLAALRPSIRIGAGAEDEESLDLARPRLKAEASKSPSL